MNIIIYSNIFSVIFNYFIINYLLQLVINKNYSYRSYLKNIIIFSLKTIFIHVIDNSNRFYLSQNPKVCKGTTEDHDNEWIFHIYYTRCYFNYLDYLLHYYIRLDLMLLA